MSPRWVVFDYGEVICSRTAAVPELAARLGVPVTDFEPAYWAYRDFYDRGAADIDYWRAIGEVVGTTVDESTSDDLTALDIAGWSRIEPSSMALLAGLAEAGSPLALLSNAPRSFARFAERQPWTRHFRHLLFSGDVGIAKPDAEIFELLTSRIGAEPGDCLFLDDKQANVDAARAVGLRAQRWVGAPDPASLR
ncbi:HAD family hydrolase [Qaidamihabitans albus]|uniref:HAD family hydrolase n=1 Tax=Qaidamihabitans albus TaxID=2795733 RepID=UPI0018F1FF6B|nr:HAD family phosphatase [Qaidamihabitans albus]